MDIRPVGNNSNAPSGQRITDAGNFSAEAPAIAARQGAAPVQTVNAVQQAAPLPGMNQVDDAVKNINAALKSLSQNLEFSIDSDSDRVIVKVVDQQTNEVIRQMPTPEALEIAKALDRVQGLLIRQKA